MVENKKAAQLCKDSREAREASAGSPIFKSQEAPSVITGKLPDTPKRPPKN